MIGFGALYAVIFVLVLPSPSLSGLCADASANPPSQVLHAALAVTSLALGYVAKGHTAGRATAT